MSPNIMRAPITLAVHFQRVTSSQVSRDLNTKWRQCEGICTTVRRARNYYKEVSVENPTGTKWINLLGNDVTVTLFMFLYRTRHTQLFIRSSLRHGQSN